VFSLNPTASGGTEQELRDPQSRISSNMEPYVSEGQPSDHIPKGHGRIIRDEDGDVIGIEVPEDETTDRDKKTYYEADDDAVSLDERTISWVQLRSSRGMAPLDNHLVVQGEFYQNVE
jgi:nucleolar protein 16